MRSSVSTARAGRPALAGAETAFGPELRTGLLRLSVVFGPRRPAIEARLEKNLRALRLPQAALKDVAAVTIGTLAPALLRRRDGAALVEHLEYHGRRLAKFNVPPARITGALRVWDRLLTPLLRRDPVLAQVRAQLHFCVLLALNNAYHAVREAESQAFYELSRVDLDSTALTELLSRTLVILRRFCRAGDARLRLFARNEGSPRRRLSRAFQCRITPSSALLDPAWVGRYVWCWSVPLSCVDATIGVMQFAFPRQYAWLPREQELLEAAAQRCARAAQKAVLVQELAGRERQVRALAAHMLQVEEMERRRISRELHDEAGQSLLCVRLQLELLESALCAEGHAAAPRAQSARTLTEKTIVEIRRLISDLSPAVLEQLGLAAAVRQLANRFCALHPVRVRLQLADLPRLPQRIEIVLYRVAQECFSNIAKHARATAASISLRQVRGRICLRVEDNGVGFCEREAAARQGSFGLAGMRERVSLLGGEFRIATRRGAGTVLTISFPLTAGECETATCDEKPRVRNAR